MQISPAISSPARTTSAGLSLVCVKSARERPAGTDGEDVVGRGDDVARTGEEEQVVTVHHHQHRFEPAQHPVGAPFLGQLGRGLRHRSLVVAKPGFEALKQAKCIRGSTREPGEHLAVKQFPNLLRIVLHDDVAKRNLAIAAQSGSGRSPDGKNRCGANTRHVKIAPGRANSALPRDNRTPGDSPLASGPRKS
jgi:hypothetical protein